MTDVPKIHDPRGLIREAYRIEGIGAEDCRSIFLDWALGLKPGQDAPQSARALLGHYADQPEDHPMSMVLRSALQQGARPRRRGGAASRR